MFKAKSRFTAALLTAALSLSFCPAALAAEPEGMTRAQVRDALLTAATDYNPGVTGEDILRGDENGELHLERTVTRAEALVMLERAFGGLPAPVGANARSAFPAEEFTDVPAWAQEELTGVFAAGIVAGTEAGRLSPQQPVSEAQLDALIRRVYALEGTQLKDDFYAAVNKQWLDSSTIPAGQLINGPFYGLSYEVNDQVAQLITGIASTPQEKGTPEAKIAALYHTVTDLEGRNQAGAEPIRKYLDAIENARDLDELLAADALMEEELAFSTLLGFGLMVDLKDSTRYSVIFSSFIPTLSQEFYRAGTPEQKEAYLTYITTLLTLSGLSQEEARIQAELVYEAEAAVSAASLPPQDAGNVDKIYNLYTMAQLQDIFPHVDLERVYAASSLKETDVIGVTDVGAMEAAAAFFDQAHLDTLKALARQALVSITSRYLSQNFTDAAYDFQAVYYGVEGRLSPEELAAAQVQGLLSDYLSHAYVDAYFSPQAKADVENMVYAFIDIYKERLQAQDWMSQETRAMALKKLDTLGVKVGYPDDWSTYLDNADIRTPEEGGTFFSNYTSIQCSAKAEFLLYQDKPVDKAQWVTSPDTVNAFYNATANDITFPAAILQAPLYDVNASREENLGAIGYVIAHEITHAFDNSGAKFDENGNAANWWTAEDYAAFQIKCDAVTAWYEGQESAPGLACSGALTLGENVADLGAVACVVTAAGGLEDPDYDALFRSMAHTWASTASRQTQAALLSADVHAPDKLRVNRVLQTIPQFYETYGIEEGDGMWVSPEERVSIW